MGMERAHPSVRPRSQGVEPRRRRTRSIVFVSLAAACALVASGCALFFQNPEVSIAEVRVVSLNLVGGTAQVSLQVVNPNGFSLTAKEVRYRLAFADEQAAEGWRTLSEGATASPVAIAARDSSSVRLEVPFRFTDLGRALGSFLSQGEIRYRLDGDVKFDAPITDLRIPFDRRGSFAP